MLQPELKLRRDKIRSLMVSQGIDAALITCNANLIYTYGCVVSGYLYLPLHSPALLFFKRPNNITGEHSFPIRKPEQIVDILKEKGLPLPTKLMLEGDELPYTEYVRLAGLFPDAEVVNGTPLIRQARSVKTAIEIEMFRRSGMAHAKAYEQIPFAYYPGMTDIEFSIEIERLMRLQGCLGIFRVFGRSMEIFMGSVLTGDNAGYPSPYDFALGGRGLDPALPGGADKTPLKEGQSVMVDLGGNFNGYMGDMSRVFSIGKLSEEAYTAHQVVWIFRKRSLRSPDPAFLAKCCITLQSKWLPRQVLPISSWERDSKPSSSVTASDSKSTKRLYLLRASNRNWNRAWSLLSNRKSFFPV